MTTVLILSGVSFLLLSLALRLVQQSETRKRGPYARFMREPQRRMTLVRPARVYKDKGDAA